MKRSQRRILTTHVGSLVRPREMVDILQRKEDGQPFTESERTLLARHVAEAVRLQAECGIDIPSDGEYSKTGFSQYITDRLTGFALRTDLPGRGGGTARSRDRKRFPDAYREIEGSSQNAPTSTGQPQVQMIHTVCTGPITYRGQKIIIPGVIAHTTNCVEHPELVAERILRYARMVGRENVIAGVDCGFAQGLATARVHPSIMWEKFRMLSEGARLASQRLWR
jgi:methionine synthase II (cobalamin-independent)